MKRFLLVKWIVMTFLALGMTGCSLFESTPGPGDDPGEPIIKILLHEDFADYEPGDFVSGVWTVIRGTEDQGIVEIVEDSELESRRALRIVGNPSGGETRISYRLPDDLLEGVETLFIEYRFKTSAGGGTGANSYVNRSGHNLNWRVMPSNGTVGYSENNKMSDIAPFIADEWNHLRLVARVKANSVDFYLNDMDTPLLEGVGFRNSLDSWVGASFQLQHSKANTPADILYSDIKIWTVD